MQKTNHSHRFFLALVIAASCINIYGQEAPIRESMPEKQDIFTHVEPLCSDQGDDCTTPALSKEVSENPADSACQEEMRPREENLQCEMCSNGENVPCEFMMPETMTEDDKQALEELINLLNPQEKVECIQSLHDASQLYEQNAQGCSCFNKLFDFINNNPYPQQTKLAVTIGLAILYWDLVQPAIESFFPRLKSPSQLANCVATVFLIDVIKDYLKTFKTSSKPENCSHTTI